MNSMCALLYLCLLEADTFTLTQLVKYKTAQNSLLFKAEDKLSAMLTGYLLSINTFHTFPVLFFQLSSSTHSWLLTGFTPIMENLWDSQKKKAVFL